MHGLREGPSVLEEKKRLRKVVEDDRRAREERRQLRRLDKGRTAGGEYLIKTSRVKGERGKNGDGDDPTRKTKRRKEEEEEEKRSRTLDTDDASPSKASRTSSGYSGDDGHSEEEDVKPTLSSVFKADALRKIGFNPTAKPGDLPRDESSETKRYRVRPHSAPCPALSRHVVDDAFLRLRGVQLALESGLADREIKLSAPKPLAKAKAKARFDKAAVEAAAPTAEADDDDDLVIEGGPSGAKPKVRLISRRTLLLSQAC